MYGTRPIGIRTRLLIGYSLVVIAAAGGALACWPAQWPAVAVIGTVSLGAAWIASRSATRHLRRQLHALRDGLEAICRDHAETTPTARQADFCKLAEALDKVLDQLRLTSHQREQLQRRLTQNEKLALIGELAATVAHEVNNPLDGLQNGVRLLRRLPPDSPQAQELLALMETGLHRIELIVRRLLTMSRDEPLRLAAVALPAVIEEAWAFVGPRAQRAGVERVCEVPEDCPALWADRDQIGQVLINLLLNAVDAMPDGGRVVIAARPVEAGRAVRLTLSDTGTGIPAEHRNHIFEPFYTTKDRGKGTGLGLSVVARVIEAHGGRIELSSVPGRGTRFELTLPAVAPSAGQPSTDDSSSAGRVTSRIRSV